MYELAIKKYVVHKVKTTFYQSNATIPKIVVNQLANELYFQFTKLSKPEQEQLLFSDELVIRLWEHYIEKVERELGA